MNETLNYNTSEQQKAIQFLEKGCKCGCSNKVPHEKFTQLRSDFQSLSKKELDTSVMTQLTFMDGGETTLSRRLKKQKRINHRTFYLFEHQKPICQQTYLNMLGIGEKYLKNIKKHLWNKGLTTRIHGNTNKAPQWKTKLNVNHEIKETVKNFILNYAQENGLPNPGRTKRLTNIVTFLPSEMTYKSVYQDFLTSRKEDDKLKTLKPGIFLKLWHQLTPQIGFMSPCSALCNTCHQFRNEVHSCQNKTVRQTLKNQFDQHLIQARLERNYYNQNTKKAREERGLVINNYLINCLLSLDKVRYCSVDATAHYSFDWSQNVHVPHFAQEPSEIYFLSPRKVYLFGIQNEATKEQTNYVLDESELLNKGSNGTLSMVFDAIKKLNKGEKHLKLTCDNTAGQNKNNATLRLCQFLVIMGYYESVELNFMIAGHTKFKVDGNFGMIKKLYRKSTVYCKEEFVEVVKKSSPAKLNKVQCYKNGKGFQYFGFKETLEKYFVKLPNIGKYHHFLFESSNLGMVKVKEFINEDCKEINLWKDENRTIENIKEINNLTFVELVPPPLKLERQEYLYQKIRPLVPEKYWDVVCPEPKSNQKDLDLSWKSYLNYESLEEAKVVSEGKWVTWSSLKGDRVWSF